MSIGWAKSGSPSALIAGIVAAGLVAIGIAALPAASRTALHERIFDTLLALAAPLRPSSASAERIVVVDIDAQSLAAYGGWPWPRSRIADLVEAIGHSGAAAVAIDILFEGPDAKSPAALAHRLGTEIGRTDINTWADTLPDGDRQLGEVLASVPVALGLALDPTGTAKLPGVPFLTRGTVILPQFWRAPGGIAPFADLLDHAAGLGASFTAMTHRAHPEALVAMQTGSIFNQLLGINQNGNEIAGYSSFTDPAGTTGQQAFSLAGTGFRARGRRRRSRLTRGRPAQDPHRLHDRGTARIGADHG
jgi:hypothetical protein